MVVVATESPMLGYGQTLKRYNYETIRGFGAALEANSLAMSAAKAAVVATAAVLNSADSVDINRIREDAPKIFAVAFAKDVAMVSARAALQILALKMSTPRLASKLMKNVPKSAIRKALRYKSASTAAVHIVRTSVFGSALTHAAIFVVEEIVLLAEYYGAVKVFCNTLKGCTEPVLKRTAHEKHELVHKTKANVTRFFGGVVCGAVGASIGTLIAPGRGTFWGGFVGDTIFYLL